MTDRETRLRVFRMLLGSVSRLFYTEYDAWFRIVETDAPEYQDLFRYFFFLDQIKELDYQYPAEAPEDLKNRPIMFTNSLGMTFVTDRLEEHGRITRIYLLGPAFLDEYSVEQLNRQVMEADFPVNISTRFKELVQGLPIIPQNRLLEYGIMLHAAITEENITISDYIISEADTRAKKKKQEGTDLPDNRGAYQAEQRFLKLVEEGNLDYKSQEAQLRRFGDSVRYASHDFLRQAKTAVIIFSTLCSRAAIRGGLDSETAFTLNDRYIQAAEAAGGINDLTAIRNTMVEDFVRRVHRIRISEGISPQIMASCDYIATHLNEPLDINILAKRLQYTDYYFSAKFKRETGMTVRDYIMKQKIDRARQMLEENNEDILSISLNLGFASQSHFGSIFRKAVGMSPGEYRAKFKKE